jgi:hypothetical protein
MRLAGVSRESHVGLFHLFLESTIPLLCHYDTELFITLTYKQNVSVVMKPAVIVLQDDRVAVERFGGSTRPRDLLVN